MRTDLVLKIDIFLGYSEAFFEAFKLTDRLAEHWFFIHILSTYHSAEKILIDDLKKELKERMVRLPDKPGKRMRVLVGELERKRYLKADANSLTCALSKDFKFRMKIYADGICKNALGTDFDIELDFIKSCLIVKEYFESIKRSFITAWRDLARSIVGRANQPSLSDQSRGAATAEIFNGTEYYIFIHLIWKASCSAEREITDVRLEEEFNRIRKGTEGNIYQALDTLKRYHFLERQISGKFALGKNYADLMASFETPFLLAFEDVRKSVQNRLEFFKVG